MITEWLQMLDKYWDEENMSYSSSSGLWPQWLFQYDYILRIYEDIESTYFKLKSEQHRLIPKCNILRPIYLY